VRVVVPTRKTNSSELMSEAACLVDSDASSDDIVKALRRTSHYAKTPKFIAAGSKTAAPMIKAILGLIRSRSSDESVSLAVLETLTTLCKCLKGVAIIIRLEGGLPPIVSLLASHIKRISFQKAGFTCLCSLTTSPQNSVAVAKTGGVQLVVQVLSDKETKYFGAENMEAAIMGVQLMICMAKSSDGTLPFVGTLQVMQSVVNAIYARVGNKRFVAVATEFLLCIVRRHVSEDITENMLQRYMDNLKRAGGIDAMFVVIGRYSDSQELFKSSYMVLNRLQRTVLTSEVLGEFSEAKQLLNKTVVDDTFNYDLCFPENAENNPDTIKYLDDVHAEALPRRGLPPAVSGVRPMLKNAGVSVALSRSIASNSREPFLPPGPDVLAEVMLLNVARWLKTRPTLDRLVYSLHFPDAPCEKLFDLARHIVSGYKGSPDGKYDNGNGFDEIDDTELEMTAVKATSAAPKGEVDPDGLENEMAMLDPVDARNEDDLDMNAIANEWSSSTLPRVNRSANLSRTQRDTVSDVSDEEIEQDVECDGDDDDILDPDDTDTPEELLDLAGLEIEDPAGLDPAAMEDEHVVAEELVDVKLESPVEQEKMLAGAEIASAGPSNLPSPSDALGTMSRSTSKDDLDSNFSSMSDLAELESARAEVMGTRRSKSCSDNLERGQGEMERLNDMPREMVGEKASGKHPQSVTSEINSKTLLFDSRFEGGNLGRVIQVHEYEYDLYLMPDINTKASQSGGNTQWYYFAVTNMEAGVEYKLNIVNFVKPDSLCNVGMRPSLFSVTEASRGVGWRRVGERIAYYENHYETETGQSYYTLTFTLVFPHGNDVCYLAHCYPYSYTDLSHLIAELLARPNASRIVKVSTMCDTLIGNKCPMLTITNFMSPPEVISRRRAICVSARVHPGETCASWTMHGFLEFLCGSCARARILRENFIFKVVPMLNPDGVINGQYRCSLSGHDLNRQWQNPCRVLHPTVHSFKQIIRYTKAARDVAIFCDIHGHSRKCNMFMYGCTSKQTALRLKERVFPYLLHNESLMFSYDDCNFKVQKYKESAARVVVWREFAIPNSYTLEMSLGGGDFGEDPSVRPPIHFNLEDYLDMGRLFCEAILEMYDPSRVRLDAALNELELLHPEIKRASGEDIMEFELGAGSGGGEQDAEAKKKKKEGVANGKGQLTKKNSGKLVSKGVASSSKTGKGKKVVEANKRQSVKRG